MTNSASCFSILNWWHRSNLSLAVSMLCTLYLKQYSVRYGNCHLTATYTPICSYLVQWRKFPEMKGSCFPTAVSSRQSDVGQPYLGSGPSNGNDTSSRRRHVLATYSVPFSLLQGSILIYLSFLMTHLCLFFIYQFSWYNDPFKVIGIEVFFRIIAQKMLVIGDVNLLCEMPPTAPQDSWLQKDGRPRQQQWWWLY